MNSFTLPSLPQKRYLTIAEASKFCNVPANTLRYWERKFPMLKPSMRTRRRYYRQQDLELILKIKYLLQDQNLSINDALLLFSNALPPSSTPGRLAHKSNQAKKLYAEVKGKEARTGAHDLNVDLGLSVRSITQICRVDERTARRYLKARKAPYTACRLLELESCGRILPDKWTHCFINKRGNLEIYQVGEVSEDDIVSIRWTNELFNGRINTLTRDLSASQGRVKELEALLAQEQARHTAETSQTQSMIDCEFTRSLNVKNPTLYSAKRGLEVVIQAFQGLEEIASRSEGDASSVGNAMVPIIYQAEEVLRELEAVYEKVQAEKAKSMATPGEFPIPTGQPLVLLTFPKPDL